MSKPWQIDWVCGRLAPRWIAENLAGRRAPCVRIAFIDAPRDAIEPVTLAVTARLGPGWRVETPEIASSAGFAPEVPPADVLWALDLEARGSWVDRLHFSSTLSGWLVPGGYLIANPTEVVVWASGLAPVSAPGVFVKGALERRHRKSPG